MAKNPINGEDTVRFGLINDLNEVLYEVRMRRLTMDKMTELSRLLIKFKPLQTLTDTK